MKKLADYLKEFTQAHPEIPNTPRPEFKIRLDRLDDKGKVISSTYLYTSLNIPSDAFNDKGVSKNQFKMKSDSVEADFACAIVRKQK